MSTQDENNSESIVRTCAMLVLDKLHHSPAMELLENETSRIIRDGLVGENTGDSKGEIMAALDIAKAMNPRKLAAELRFEVSMSKTQIDLKRHVDHSAEPESEPSGDTVSILVPPGIPVEPLLAAIGFETYEALPAHLVTPLISPCESSGNNLTVVQAILGMLGQSADLGYYLSYVASVGGILEFLRWGHARTGKADFEATPAEIVEFLQTIDIKAVLESITIEAHGNDMILFTVPDLPLEVLARAGSNELNRVHGAEELVQVLGLSGFGEVTGAQLLDRDIPAPCETPAEPTGSDEPND